MTSLPQLTDQGLSAVVVHKKPAELSPPLLVPFGRGAVRSSTQVEQGHDPLIEIFLRRISTILCLTAGGVVAAGIYLLIATHGYLLTSRLYIQNTQPKLLADTDDIVSKSDKFLATQSAIMKSYSNLDRALDAANAKSMRTFDGVNDRVQFLVNQLDIDVGKKDDIVSVSFQSPSKEEAAIVVNEVVSAYMAFQSDQRRSTALQVLRILRRENDKADAEVLAKRSALASMKGTGRAILPDSPKDDVVYQKLLALTQQLLTTQAESARAKAAYEEALAISSDPVRTAQWADSYAAVTGSGAVQLNPEGQQLRTELNNLQLNLEVLRRQYGPSHPSYASLQTYVEAIKAKIAEQEQRTMEGYVAKLRSAWTEDRKLESDQEADLRQQELLAEKFSARSDTYNALLYDLQAAEKRRDALGDRISDFTVEGESGGLNITVLEPANPQTAEPRPRKLLILLLGLAAGLAAGCGAALVQDRLDDRLPSTRAVLTAIGLPVLATIPRMSRRGRKTIAKHGLKLLLDPSSWEAESFRSLRTAVCLGPARDDVRSLLITSAVQGEGKSTIASNLAIAMAQAGQRILLIDSDLRGPMQHLIFSLNKGPGVSEVMSGQARLKQAIQHTSIPRLDLLSCGELPPDPSEILNARSFADILHKLATVYDRIILDSPPVLSFTDARVLGAVCDGTLLVIRAGRSSRSAVLEAAEAMASLGTCILGTVVNRVSWRERRYRRYHAHDHVIVKYRSKAGNDYVKEVSHAT